MEGNILCKTHDVPVFADILKTSTDAGVLSDYHDIIESLRLHNSYTNPESHWHRYRGSDSLASLKQFNLIEISTVYELCNLRDIIISLSLENTPVPVNALKTGYSILDDSLVGVG